MTTADEARYDAALTACRSSADTRALLDRLSAEFPGDSHARDWAGGVLRVQQIWEMRESEPGA